MPQPRSVEPTPQDRRTAQAAAAAVAAAVARGAVAPNPPAPPVTLPMVSVERIAQLTAVVVGLLAQHAEQRHTAEQTFLRERLTPRTRQASDVETVMAQEAVRGREFTRLAEQRMRRDLPIALAIPDDAQREAAVRGLMQREQTYARYRAEAMAARAFAAVDRMVLRRESPTGAFWKLDPTVKEHTAGCLIMGGRFWPWEEVLDRVHPPRHPACPCRLVGYGEAVRDGLLVPGSVMDVADAVKAAAGVVMEASGIVGFAQHAFDEAKHPRDQHGQWRESLSQLGQAGAWARSGGVTFKDKGHGMIDVHGPGGRGGSAFSHDEAIKLAHEAVAAKPNPARAEGIEDPQAFGKVFHGFEHGGIKVQITHAERVGDEADGNQGTEVSGDLIADGKVVGYIVRNVATAKSGLGNDGKQGGTWAYNHELRLHPDYHRRGFATALQDHAEKQLAAAGVREIHTTAQDAGSVVWAKRGFQPKGTWGSTAEAELNDMVARAPNIRNRIRGNPTDAEMAELKRVAAAAKGDISKVAETDIGRRFLEAWPSWNGRKVLTAPEKAAA